MQGLRTGAGVTSLQRGAGCGSYRVLGFIGIQGHRGVQGAGVTESAWVT